MSAAFLGSGIGAAALGGVASGVVGSLMGGGSGGQSLELTEEQKQAQKMMLGVAQGFKDNNLALSNQNFSRTQALADSQGLVAEIFNQYKNNALPEIYQGQVSSGGYNSTTSQLLANDAFASASSKAAAQMVDTILKYNAANQNDFKTFADLIRSISGGTAVGEGSNPLAGMLGQGVGSIVSAGAQSFFGPGNAPGIGLPVGHNGYTGSPV